MLSRHSHLMSFEFVFVVILFLAALVFIVLPLNRAENGKSVFSTPANETYFVYETVDKLVKCEGEKWAQFLPVTASDIWISRESGFGYEGWQVSCIVPEHDFCRFATVRLNTKTDLINIFWFRVDSYKMCNFFYQKRLGISADDVGNIRERNRFLKCYVHDKENHWHLTYCYDRSSTILSCDIGR